MTALAAREAAERKASQYERDWYDAKSEFGDAMTRTGQQLRAVRSERDAVQGRANALEAQLRDREDRLDAIQAELRSVTDTCEGFEVEPGMMSGCSAHAIGADDCPSCGHAQRALAHLIGYTRITERGK